MRFKIRHLWLIIIVALIVMPSCKKGQSTEWNTQLLIPIASTNLSLQNLVKDSSLVVNKDSSLTLAYQSSLYQFNLANQIIKIPDTAIGQKFTLDSLGLPNLRLDFRTSLGDIAQNMISSSSLFNQALGQLIISDNDSYDSIPSFSGITPGSFSFDAAQYFDSAYLTSGQVQAFVVNHLPVAIAPGEVVTISNNIPGNNSVVATQVINEAIPPGDSVYLVLNLGSAHITSNLLFTITNFGIEHSNGKVWVDTTEFIDIHIFIAFLRVSQAWAAFPSQSVVDVTQDVTQVIADRKFTYVIAKSGTLNISITNSVPQPLFLQYTLVGAYDNKGNPLVEYTTVPAAINGVGSTIDSTIDISGYSINLTGQNGSEFNTYTQRIVAIIDSNGSKVHITLADSLNIKYTISNIAPNYIKGYVGRDTVYSNDSAAFNFLNIFKSGTLNLQSVNMNFSVVNGIGVGGEVIIDTLMAVNASNQYKLLSGPIVGSPLIIQPATDFPLTPSVNNFSFNNNNSNINSLLGLLPDKLYFTGWLKTNINGNNKQYRQFAYLSSSLGINLNAEIPLSLIANNLVLQDTIAFNLSNTTTNVNGISGGIINVIAENMYPIMANLSIIIYDGNWNAVDTLILNQQIAAGELDNNCRVDQPKRTVLQVTVNQNVMNKIKQGQNAVITSNFSTYSNNPMCNGQHLKIYSNYTIGITLSAKFNYKASANVE